MCTHTLTTTCVVRVVRGVRVECVLCVCEESNFETGSLVKSVYRRGGGERG